MILTKEIKQRVYRIVPQCQGCKKPDWIGRMVEDRGMFRFNCIHCADRQDVMPHAVLSDVED